ncbi:MAG: ERAP1-like C-terminal domain-containing protein, partial [Micromonosporaceae bacterium]
VLKGWLSQPPSPGRDASREPADGVPAGLAVDTDLRWHLVQSLVAAGALGPDTIDAESRRDATASGRVQALHATALVPTAEAKAETWRRLTEDTSLPNSQLRALAHGFQHPLHVELIAPYADRYFQSLPELWAEWDGDLARAFAIMLYPAYQVSERTVATTDAWLADESHPASLRRLVAEGRDGVVRALAARARDTAALP